MTPTPTQDRRAALAALRLALRRERRDLHHLIATHGDPPPPALDAASAGLRRADAALTTALAHLARTLDAEEVPPAKP